MFESIISLIYHRGSVTTEVSSFIKPGPGKVNPTINQHDRLFGGLQLFYLDSYDRIMSHERGYALC